MDSAIFRRGLVLEDVKRELKRLGTSLEAASVNSKKQKLQRDTSNIEGRSKAAVMLYVGSRDQSIQYTNPGANEITIQRINKRETNTSRSQFYKKPKPRHETSKYRSAGSHQMPQIRMASQEIRNQLRNWDCEIGPDSGVFSKPKTTVTVPENNLKSILKKTNKKNKKKNVKFYDRISVILYPNESTEMNDTNIAEKYVIAMPNGDTPLNVSKKIVQILKKNVNISEDKHYTWESRSHEQSDVYDNYQHTNYNTLPLSSPWYCQNMMDKYTMVGLWVCNLVEHMAAATEKRIITIEDDSRNLHEEHGIWKQWGNKEQRTGIRNTGNIKQREDHLTEPYTIIDLSSGDSDLGYGSN